MKFVNLEILKYYDKLIKDYINVKVELTCNKRTNCPNCGAPIEGMKCEYCGTDFETIMRIS